MTHVEYQGPEGDVKLGRSGIAAIIASGIPSALEREPDVKLGPIGSALVPWDWTPPLRRFDPFEFCQGPLPPNPPPGLLSPLSLWDKWGLWGPGDEWER